MAEGSGVTLVFHLSRLPIFAGAEALARRRFLTRASATNSAYVAPVLLKEGRLDPVRTEFFYDAQTSGGMLMCVPAEQAERAVALAREQGAAATCIIGEAIERRDASLILKD